jgi:hypothetical protein
MNTRSTKPIETSQSEKPEYQSPVLLPLGQLQQGFGALCRLGSSASTGCSVGTFARVFCAKGTIIGLR